MISSSIPNNVSLPSLEKDSSNITPGTRSGTTSPLTTLSQNANDSISNSNSNTNNSIQQQRYYYLSTAAVNNLPKFQYNGSDLSLLYKYVLSPLASFLVDYCTPTSMAPNSITLLGLTWMVFSYTVIWYYCPNLYEGNTDLNTNYDVPSTIFLLNGCAMLIYQTLDNMDGKQARKTKSSSPLGLLFDHGCDAMNSILGSANWIAAMGMVCGNVSDLSSLVGAKDIIATNVQSKSILSNYFGGDAILATLLILCPMIAFYISTWEQYYTGKLVLPPFNGPSEGLVMGASLSFISWYWGVMYWQSTSLMDGVIDMLGSSSFAGSSIDLGFMEGHVRNMDLIILASIVGLAQEVVLKIISVARVYGLQCLRTLLPNIILVVSTLVMVHYDSTLLLRRPRVMMHLISGLFTEMTVQIMLDHMVEQNYEVCKRWCLVPQVCLAAWIMSGESSIETLDTILLVYTTGLWVYLSFKLRVIIHEICDVLGIYCFDIVTPHPKKKKLM